MMALACITVRSAGCASEEQPSVITLTQMAATATRFLRLKSATARIPRDFLVSQFQHQNSLFIWVYPSPRGLVRTELSVVNGARQTGGTRRFSSRIRVQHGRLARYALERV